MIARLHRRLLLAAAVLWGYGLWHLHPGPLGWLGWLAVPPLALGLWLALIFVAAACINRGSPPQPQAAQLLRAWLAEWRCALLVFGWRQPFRSARWPDYLPAGEQRRGMVLVHGFNCNRGFWQPWLRRLRAQRRAYVAVNLEPPFGPIESYARIIQDAVQRLTEATGQPPLLVCHSMGGLAVRAWLRYHPGPCSAHHIVTIGTPHAGAWLARFGRCASTVQMRMAGQWLAHMTGAEESTRQAPFTCWYSNCDGIVFPTHTATLAGADNRAAHGLAHVEMAFATHVMAHSFGLLDDAAPTPPDASATSGP